VATFDLVSTSSSKSSAATDAPTLFGPTVSTQWLADHLGAENLVVLDATVLQAGRPDGSHGWQSGLQQYEVAGHIPSAVFADLLVDFSDASGEYGFTRPDAAQFEASAAAAGIDNHTTVVVYDSASGQWASRIWWLFRAFGYDSVAVLDGGYAKWIAEGRTTDRGHVDVRKVAGFSATERPELWADKSYIEAVVAGSVSATLVCGLPPKEFTGEAGQRARLGHIPGSISAPAGRLVSRETNALLPLEALRETFADALATDSPIVTYCAVGIAASADALALTLLGRTDVALYDGSLSEWSAQSDTPLTTIAAA
jgi:thiosulfate/3-mercaptopyruvate sulfurtransferase